MLLSTTSVAWLPLAAMLIETATSTPMPKLTLSRANEARQSNQFFSITGPKVGGVQPRLEIRQLQQDREAWNLFLLAMQRFQAMDQSDELSYYQIAGIHGAPFYDWDGVEGSGDVGYCTHGSNLFATWHRPYLSLFEQILVDRALEVVNEFPEGPTKERYRAASSRLRLPYWDWATKLPAGAPALPASISAQTVQVTYPNGKSGSIPNPLNMYQFHPINSTEIPFDYPIFNQWPTTVRQPSNPQDIRSSSRNDIVNRLVLNTLESQRSRVYSWFTVYQPFTQSTNHGSPSIGLQDLETLHDNIHVKFGNGHMGTVPVAAFDPVFWLHHCNIDRLLAMWQARFPDTYVAPYENQGSTFTIQAGSIQDTMSPLTPFHADANGNFWTSEASRKTQTFGYTYPELQGNPSNQTLMATINSLYGSSRTGVAARDVSLSERQSNDTRRDYFARVNLPTNNETQYSVLIFLGDFGSNIADWQLEDNLVDAHTVLMTPSMETGNIVTADIPLSGPLRQKNSSGDLPNLDEESVIDYLKSNLHWRIQQQDLSEIPRAEAPNGLEVVVTSIEVEPPKSASDFPKYVGDFVDHPEVSGE